MHTVNSNTSEMHKPSLTIKIQDQKVDYSTIFRTAHEWVNCSGVQRI